MFTTKELFWEEETFLGIWKIAVVGCVFSKLLKQADCTENLCSGCQDSTNASIVELHTIVS